jgi:2-keto-4-pentenoate hydratase/2-oxohepta-3-ene-1,7-dioic acid hydratase in catechol pathway
MRFAVYHSNDRRGLAVDLGAGFRGLFQDETGYPGDLDQLIGSHADLSRAARALARGTAIDPEAVQLLPPLPNPGKIICIGLNYADHSAEVGIALPDYPTVFIRFSSSLIGHAAPVSVPRQSIQFDYEGELVAVIGHGGRNISREQALDRVAGYSIFNDISVRDYQFRTPQWTMGKNFDGTGVFGPTFVTADALPPGCKGLDLTTRLNGEVVQHAPIAAMVFDVEALVSLLSEVFTLSPGDVIVTGTPSGIGMSRKPPLWMKPGDVCEVEISSLGVSRTPIT